jgi:hypothetical protein
MSCRVVSNDYGSRNRKSQPRTAIISQIIQITSHLGGQTTCICLNNLPNRQSLPKHWLISVVYGTTIQRPWGGTRETIGPAQRKKASSQLMPRGRRGGADGPAGHRFQGRDNAERIEDESDAWTVISAAPTLSTRSMPGCSHVPGTDLDRAELSRRRDDDATASLSV